MSTLAMFMPLAKVDADRRIVQGIATAEKPDRSGEVCDYVSTKPYFEAWSEQCRDASGGKSLGAVRAMHGPIAAGKLTDITFDDTEKRIIVAAKIVDDEEWNKVLEGVYTGFSQGGRYIARWEDDSTGLTRYTAEPFEISLVDIPCLPDATFEVVRNGVSEFRKFTALTHLVNPEPPTVSQETKLPNANVPFDAVGAFSVAQPTSIEALNKAAATLKNAVEALEKSVLENKQLNSAVVEFNHSFAAIETRLATLEAQPAPARAFLRAPPKERDGIHESAGDSVEAAVKRLAALPDEQRALALTKISLANPLARPF